jgi:hypothetical protein
MARTLEEMDRELTDLRRQVHSLQRKHPWDGEHPQAMVGCFTSDPEWASIHTEIEESRRQPDTLQGSPGEARKN